MTAKHLITINFKIMNELEFYRKEKEICDKFSQEFLNDHAKFDPLSYSVIQQLTRGADIYKILEDILVKNRQNVKEIQLLSIEKMNLITQLNIRQ